VPKLSASSAECGLTVVSTGFDNPPATGRWRSACNIVAADRLFLSLLGDNMGKIRRRE
jgi:hypothetical protein